MCEESPEIPEEFIAWAKLGDLASQSNQASVEVLDELKPWIDAKKVKVDTETERYFSLLGSYPIGLNRIDWRGVRSHLAFDVLPADRGPMSAAEHEEKLTACQGMLRGWFCSHCIDLRDPIIWIGDDSSISLHMAIETLLELYPLLFSWPQHHYVLPSTGVWCLNYTMEGQLFFGFSANAIARGQVDLDSMDHGAQAPQE